jgi:hypothetical protein
MKQAMKYEAWIEEVKKLCGDKEDYEYFAEWYSWITAFDEGKTPKQAYKDCYEWMNS